MTEAFPMIYLVRHGETEWSRSRRHTGRTDIGLTEEGEASARQLAARLHGNDVSAVWSSPSRRARRTCELAGFTSGVVVKEDLQEWDYGDYEGITTKDILLSQPAWQLFRDGAPGGESVSEVGARADRVVRDLRQLEQSVLIFSSSHFLRVLAVRWLGMPAQQGQSFVLDTATVSVLGYEHNLEEPVIRRWNEAG